MIKSLVLGGTSWGAQAASNNELTRVAASDVSASCPIPSPSDSLLFMVGLLTVPSDFCEREFFFLLLGCREIELGKDHVKTVSGHV